MTEGKNKQGQDASPSQHDRFIEAARKLGCDEDEAAFDEKLAVVARAKPKDEGQKSGKSRQQKTEK